MGFFSQVDSTHEEDGFNAKLMSCFQLPKAFQKRKITTALLNTKSPGHRISKFRGATEIMWTGVKDTLEGAENKEIVESMVRISRIFPDCRRLLQNFSLSHGPGHVLP